MNKKLVFAIVALVIGLGLIVWWFSRGSGAVDERTLEEAPPEQVPSRGLAPGGGR